jgi:hypothetical protein
MIYYLTEEMVNSLIYCSYLIMVTAVITICCCATDKKREETMKYIDEPPKYMV